MAIPNSSTDMLVNFSTNVPNWMQGGYTSLLLDQDASAARKLHFDEEANDATYKK
jgi:hypothetical protein